MFNKSIAYRLSIFISLAVVAVFLAFIIVIYVNYQDMVLESIENKANKLSMETVSLVHKQLISTQEITKNIADQFVYYAEHNNEDLLINSIMDRYSFLNAIYISIDSIDEINNSYLISRNNNDIEFYSGDEKIFHCDAEMEIFNELKADELSKWSEVYRCDTGSTQTIAYYSPIQVSLTKDKSRKIGSVVCELSLQTLNDSINHLKIGDRGFAFLVNNEGTYITHPENKWIFNRNLYTIPDKNFDNPKPNVNMILNDHLSGSMVAYPEYLNFEKSWVHYTPIVETGWLLIVVVPYDELYFTLYMLILKMLFFSAMGILFIFFIVTYISNKQIQPLSKVTTQLKKFSNLSGAKDLNTLNEVKIVSESLNSIRTWYDKYKIDQFQEEKLNAQQKQDLQEASEIQMSLINTDFSGFKNHKDIDLYALYKPARIVSGDLFDFFFIKDNNLFFSIGDVSGKGISAAFFMSVAQTIIKGNAKFGDPEKIVHQVNNELTTANQHQFFLTLFIGVLNLKTGILNYCNAAHTPTLILKSNGEILELAQSHGMPLGIYSNKKYTGSSVTLERGDTIVLYTDGVTELLNDNDVLFGRKKLKHDLKLQMNNSPKEIAENILLSLENHRGKLKQSDDITILAINYKSIKKA